MSSLTLRTEVPRGPYPERLDRPQGALDRYASQAVAPMLRRRLARRGRWIQFPSVVSRYGRELSGLADDGIRRVAETLRSELRTGTDREDRIAQTFALVREVAGRTLGERHFDVQLIGGRVLLAGMIAEMETGEGKTLTATLAACTAALAGIPVHVVTVNDYLAARDAEAMSPIYRALGLTVGVIVHGKTPAERRAAYACDVTYATNKEVAFDYLRDRLVLGKRSENLRLKLERLHSEADRAAGVVMRGLHFAIVDEADSVLIDEARTPLIISGDPQSIDDRRWADEALALTRKLSPGEHYRVFVDERRVELTSAGIDRVAALGRELGGLWC